VTYPADTMSIEDAIAHHKANCRNECGMAQDGGYLRYTCCGLPRGLLVDPARDDIDAKIARRAADSYRKRRGTNP
jgi:hypothetical protein